MLIILFPLIFLIHDLEEVFYSEKVDGWTQGGIAGTEDCGRGVRNFLFVLIFWKNLIIFAI